MDAMWREKSVSGGEVGCEKWGWKGVGMGGCRVEGRGVV